MLETVSAIVWDLFLTVAGVEESSKNDRDVS